MNSHRFKGNSKTTTPPNRHEPTTSPSTTPTHKGRTQLNKNSPRQLNKFDNHGDHMQKDLVRKSVTPKMLVIPSGATIQRLQCFKTKRCRFWLEGRCNRGESCTYAHTDVELRCPPDLTKTKLCTRWKRGICDKDANECAYAHGVEDLRETNQNTPINMTPSTTASRNCLEMNDANFGDDDEEDEDTDESFTDHSSEGDEEEYFNQQMNPTEIDMETLDHHSSSRDDYYQDNRAINAYHCRNGDDMRSKLANNPEVVDDASTAQSQTHCGVTDLPLSLISSNSTVSLDTGSLDDNQMTSQPSITYRQEQTGDPFSQKESWSPLVHDEGIVQNQNSVLDGRKAVCSELYSTSTYDVSNSYEPLWMNMDRDVQPSYPDVLTETYFD